MSRPTYTAANSTFKLELPARWYSTIFAVGAIVPSSLVVVVNVLFLFKVSRKPYQQGVKVQRSYIPEVYDLLVSEEGKTGETMSPARTPGTPQPVDTLAMDEPYTVTIDFYYSTTPISRPGRIMRDEYRSNSMQVVQFKKSDKAPKDVPDYQDFVIFVEDTGGPEPGKAYDDAVIAIHCVKAGPDDPPAPNPDVQKYRLYDIQAEIVPGITKAFEYFYFFSINDLAHFRQVVKDWVIPKITIAAQVVYNTVPPSGLPIPGRKDIGLSLGFTSSGLRRFGLNDSLQDDAFHKGQRADAKDLGDDGTDNGASFSPDWDSEFKMNMDGIFQIATHDDDVAKGFIAELEKAFRIDDRSSSINKILNLRTTFRPAPHTTNEHFGFRDGISRPEIEGVTYFNAKGMRYPGSPEVPLGLIVMGFDGDVNKATRPAWAVGGSFLVFRKLKSLVPEYNDFAFKEGQRLFPQLTPQKAADRFGARLFGRWKSGVPLVLSPQEDNGTITEKQFNLFDYDPQDQTTCPFSAHTRKSYARSDTPDSKSHLFRRASIPYGPEVTPAEEQQRKTLIDRGLVFVCYQSSIENGFKFIQKNSINNPNFPPGKRVRPGHDPIMGSTGKQDVWRYTTGANPLSQAVPLDFPTQFVHADGGEYFFFPPISTLRDRIAL